MFIEKGFGASLSSKNVLATSKQPTNDGGVNASSPGGTGSYFLQVFYGVAVPSSITLDDKWHKIVIFGKFPLCDSGTWRFCRVVDEGKLDRGDDSHVKGRLHPISPHRDENVCWSG
jgi:hypothetical protein